MTDYWKHIAQQQTEKTQMEEERMLYIAFRVNVAWYTLEKLGNGLMQEHSNIKQP